MIWPALYLLPGEADNDLNSLILATDDMANNADSRQPNVRLYRAAYYGYGLSGRRGRRRQWVFSTTINNGRQQRYSPDENNPPH
jgi:hypothetical protein